MMNIREALKINPVIAAIRDTGHLSMALQSDVKIIFILAADIFNISAYIHHIREAGKLSFVHIDFLEGLGKDKKAIEFIAKKIKPDGIITTRSNLIKYAKDCSLYAIQRFFIVDSQSLETCIKTVLNVQSDLIEIMPGIMPQVVKDLSGTMTTPIIAGGLISKQEDVTLMMNSGAIGISTGNTLLWK
ncbi:MAG: glycerol-3-phosphate responsive antiterminator [Clostridia bacterium]|nr:glycerol-3-phosphate responsive antiterminator [Clostridia bacterium]